MLRKHTCSVLAIVFAGTTVLQGCASTGRLFGGEDLTPAQQSLRDGADDLADAAEEIEGCSGGERVAGAIMLGLLGALAGAAVADDDHRLAGLMIGAGAGAAGGYAAGSYVGAKNCEYATAQDALQTRIAEAQTEATNYKRMASEAHKVVAQHQNNIAKLNAEYQQHLITKDDYKKKIAGLSKDVEALKSLIDSNELTVASFEEEIGNLSTKYVDTSKLRAQRDQLVAQRQKLKAELELLVASVDAIPPEVRPAGV